jgi:RHS repeat-associated protein
MEYFAFGETFVEVHSNTDKTPYLFNGKELDEETGLYYYGARYYDPKISIWLTLDPLMDHASSWSPYAYTLDNPIILRDPDGRWPDWGAIADFGNGFVNAVASNNTTITSANGTVLAQGFKRESRSSGAFTLGQKLGDAFSVAQGVAEFVLGETIATGGVVGGVVTSPTGVGAVAGAAVATGGVVVAAHGANTAKEGLRQMLNSEGTGNGYQPSEPLPRKESGEPMPDPEATGPHTQVGTQQGRKGPYKQAREFDGNGQPVKDIDFTDHGRPNEHTNPHQHEYIPNPSGGTPQRGGAEPLEN